MTSGSFTIAALFSWSNILQPVNTDGSSIFKLGSTIPVKFKLTSACAGNSSLVATIWVDRGSSFVDGTTIEATSTSAADSGNVFRYDPTGDQYIYNLATKPLSQGTWYIFIDLSDGLKHSIKISLKK